jgi:hypothetical protein
VTSEQVQSEIDRLVAPFGEQSAMYRSLFERPEMVANLRNDLLTQQTYDRIAAIARGEDPEKGSPAPAPAAEADAGAVAEAPEASEESAASETSAESESSAVSESTTSSSDSETQ